MCDKEIVVCAAIWVQDHKNNHHRIKQRMEKQNKYWQTKQPTFRFYPSF